MSFKGGNFEGGNFEGNNNYENDFENENENNGYEINYNIDDYTIEELLSLANITINDSLQDITNKTNLMIDQAKQRNEDPHVIDFLEQLQIQVINYFHSISQENTYTNEIQEWTSNQNLTQPNSTQRNKITDRTQQIQILDNSPNIPDNNNIPVDSIDNNPTVMKRNQLGVSNEYTVPVVQGVLNPNLKNTIKRFINLDSQYRNNYKTGLNTDYTSTLTESLHNVLSLKLYSYQIPYSWYAFDDAYLNNYFWIVCFDEINPETGEVYKIKITVPSGNYSVTDFTTTLINAIEDAGFVFAVPNDTVTYNANTGKLSFQFIGGEYNPSGTNVIFTINDTNTEFVFYDETCTNCRTDVLGWAMGFREEIVPVLETNIGEALLDVQGTKYLMLAISDYNQNSVNNPLISLGEQSIHRPLPDYYRSKLPNSTTVTTLNENNIPQVQASAPRILTQPQIYTINEIFKSNNEASTRTLLSPTTPDMFAMLPIGIHRYTLGSIITEFSSSLKDCERIYFGPVDISNLQVKLLNDKGHVLNLNGLDWNCMLISEQLYQY